MCRLPLQRCPGEANNLSPEVATEQHAPPCWRTPAFDLISARFCTDLFLVFMEPPLSVHTMRQEPFSVHFFADASSSRLSCARGARAPSTSGALPPAAPNAPTVASRTPSFLGTRTPVFALTGQSRIPRNPTLSLLHLATCPWLCHVSLSLIPPSSHSLSLSLPRKHAPTHSPSHLVQLHRSLRQSRRALPAAKPKAPLQVRPRLDLSAGFPQV